jgi:1,4-dihydroxy-2-naphthoate polyprenyltransferase
MSSLLSYGVGAAVAAYAGLSIDLRLYALGQVFVWLVHLMTHYCNEYFDLSADQANAGTTGWTGGSRVLVEGALRPVVSLVASLVTLVCSLTIAITATSGGARAFALLAVGLAWFYTAPPFQFNYRGLGELTVALVLNFLFPFIGGYLQAGSVPHLLPFLCIPIMRA